MSGYGDNLIMTFGERTHIPIVVYPVKKSKDHVYGKWKNKVLKTKFKRWKSEEETDL